MKKLFLLALLVAPAMLFAAVTETVLYENDFDSYVTGNFYGQDADYEIMHSDVSCVGQEPADGEITIVYDEELASNVLCVKKVKEPEGLSSSDAKKDRGLRVPLTWGTTQYNEGQDAYILITGKLKATGNGYAELRLASSTDTWMMRFCPYGNDGTYKTYAYNYNDSRAINSGAANKDDTRFQTTEGRSYYDDGYKLDTWCDFELYIDCETGVLGYMHITDGGAFDFTGENVTILKGFRQAPYYFEFTAEGNGYDTNRAGACFDDLKISFFQNHIPWVTVFEDDFSSYNVGDSLTAVSLDYKRIGDEATFSDLIENDGTSNYAKLWINTPSGSPYDGVYYELPETCVLAEGTKLKFTAITRVPDNGVWAALYNDNKTEAALGYHSANAWFTTWTEGATTSPRYSGRERNIYGSYYTTCKLTVAVDSEGPYLESTYIGTSQASHINDTWGCPWGSYDFDTHLAKTPNRAAITVLGYPNKDVRYTCLKYFKVEYAAPEPGMIALLALFGLAFLRRK